MFLIIVILVMSLLHGFVGARMIAPFSLSGSGLYIYWSLIAGLAMAPMTGMILRARGIENSYTDMLLWVGYTSLGLFSLAFVAFFIRDLGWLIGILSTKFAALFRDSDYQSSKIDLERRQFILMSINYGIAASTGVLGLVGLFQAKNLPKIFRQKIEFKTLPKSLHGLRIVQLSDLHVGPTIKGDYVQKVVDQVNTLDPDLILFTGDMVDGSVEHLANDVEPLRGLRARFGKFFVTGNHEYYSGVEFWEQKVADLGLIHLKNEHRILEIRGESLAIAGVTDLSAHRILKSHRSDPKQAVAGIPASMPTIMLAHQPGSAEQAEGLQIDLMLCGHTHGGQYMPFHLAVGKAHQYIAGLYQHGDMQVYVNQGTGYWGPPLRLGIPSEITLFELGSAEMRSTL